MDKLRWRLRVEIVLTVVSFVLGILTVAIPDWIELITGFDPDRGSGGFEWTVTGALLVTALVAAASAGNDYRRLAAQRGG